MTAKPISATTGCSIASMARGMKTGYIRASGYGLATAIPRNSERVIVVVLGSDSPQSRDRHVAALAERSLPRAKAIAEATLSAAQRKRAAAWLNRPLLPSPPIRANRQHAKLESQVSAFAASNHALSQLKRVRRVLGTHLEMAEESTEPIEKNGKQFIAPASPICLSRKLLSCATSCAMSRPIVCPSALNCGLIA